MRTAVVIPTLDEESFLPTTLEAIRPQLADDDLLVIADGGSLDDTLATAHGYRAHVVSTEAGRGTQLDAGARRALELGADLLLFLHADSRPPPGLLEELRRLQPRTGGGCLVEFIGGPALLRLGSALVNWRTRVFRVPLGDQGQFAAAEAYSRSGGYPPWPILEDTEFLRRLRRVGPLDILPLAVRSDARRFRDRGVLRTVVMNWAIWTAFALGRDPHDLVRWYRSVR